MTDIVHCRNWRIAFLYKGGRAERVEEQGPTEFLYGLPQLRARGWDAIAVDETTLNIPQKSPGRLLSAANHLFYILFGLPLLGTFHLSRPINRRLLNQFDVLVATTNTLGLALSLLAKVGLIKPRVIFIAMGLVEAKMARRIVFIYRWIFRGVELCTVAELDAASLASQIDHSVVAIPFGVDLKFWHPQPEPEGSFVLSIGNDRHRDFDTLVAAWKPEYPFLRIVSSLQIDSKGKANIEIIRGDWRTQIFTDAEIRSMMCRARFVVLPIRDTVQPSGQSACLQAMACGKAVVLTDFGGLWNRELMKDQVTCILAGPPGSVSGIQHSVERLLENPLEVRRIGDQARAVVADKLTVDHMAWHVSKILESSGESQKDTSAA